MAVSRKINRVEGERMQRLVHRVQDDLCSLVALLKEDEGPHESPHYEVRENVYDAINALEKAGGQIFCKTEKKVMAEADVKIGVHFTYDRQLATGDPFPSAEEAVASVMESIRDLPKPKLYSSRFSVSGDEGYLVHVWQTKSGWYADVVWKAAK